MWGWKWNPRLPPSRSRTTPPPLLLPPALPRLSGHCIQGPWLWAQTDARLWSYAVQEATGLRSREAPSEEGKHPNEPLWRQLGLRCVLASVCRGRNTDLCVWRVRWGLGKALRANGSSLIAEGSPKLRASPQKLISGRLYPHPSIRQTAIPFHLQLVHRIAG